MNAKTTVVTLCVGEENQDFEITHAERLLNLRGSVWRLPENSKFEFVENAIRYKQAKKGVEGKQ